MELVTNTRRGRFITDEFHLMEDNMIVEEKAHGSKKYIYILTIFFSFTPTNKYKCSP